MPFHGAALAVTDLDLFLGGHHHVEDFILHAHGLDALFEIVPHLVFHAGIAVDHVPGWPALGDRFEGLLRNRSCLANRFRLA